MIMINHYTVSKIRWIIIIKKDVIQHMGRGREPERVMPISREFSVELPACALKQTS